MAAFSFSLSVGLLTAAPGQAQVQAGGAPSSVAPIISPVLMPNGGRDQMLAQGVTGAADRQPQPFDLTPVRLPERGSAFGTMQSFRTNALYRLPAKMFFTATVENSLRVETNVLETNHHNHTDMVYRALPNVTLGYALNRTTRVAANYFMFRDQYAFSVNPKLSRTVHSVGFRLDHDFILSPKTTLTTGVFGRELFITKTDELTDIIPSATLVHRVGPRTAVYSSVLGQLRWQDMFSKWQEGDQFYSIGAVYRTPKWTALFDTTLIDNFGRPSLRNGAASNNMIVVSTEIDRKISNVVPLYAFMRVEPIFNMGQKRQGYAGVDFRLFGGIRAEINKPAIFPVRLRG